MNGREGPYWRFDLFDSMTGERLVSAQTCCYLAINEREGLPLLRQLLECPFR
jgi:hypothetical protein